MKARRSTVTPAEVTRTSPDTFRINQLKTIPKMEISSCKLLKIKGKGEPPNKLLEIKGKNKKDVKNEGTSQ